MLVGGRVEYGIRAAAPEHRAEARAVTHVGDDRRQSEAGVGLPQLVQDIEDLVLVIAQEHQLCRPEPRQLPGQLAADGAAGPGDQHRAPVHAPPHRPEVGPDRLAPQQILDFDLAEMRHPHSSGEDVEQPRHGAGGQVRLLRGLHHSPDHGARGGRERDDHLVDLLARDYHRNLGQLPEDRQVAQAVVAFRGIVVDETDGGKPELWVGQHLLQDHLPCRAGAGDQHALPGARSASPAPGGEDPDQHAGRRRCGERKERVQEQDRDGHTHCGQAEARQQQDPEQRTRRGHDPACLEDLRQVGYARVAPQAGIQSEREAQHELDRKG